MKTFKEAINGFNGIGYSVLDVEKLDKKYNWNLPIKYPFYEHFAIKYGWTFWYDYGDELV